MTSRKNRTIREQLMDFTVFNNKGCWLFNANIGPWYYAYLWYKGEYQGVHRISYQLNKGRIPKGLQVLHTCDTPRCWNPDHLFLGTSKENHDDAVAKGRKQWTEGRFS